MADQKVSQLTALTTGAAVEDYFLIIDADAGPISKRITVENLLGNVNANTVFNYDVSVAGNTSVTGLLSVANNRIQIKDATPATISNNTTTQFGTADAVGSIFWDSGYLYVAVDATTIKRAPLETFS